MKTIIATLLIIFATAALAGPPSLHDADTGEFLGTLSSNPYDPDSVSNPHGRYGSEHSRKSINNPYGPYGSEHSQKSVNNPYARSAPEIRGR